MANELQRPCSQFPRSHGFEPFDEPVDISKGAGQNARCSQLCDEDIGEGCGDGENSGDGGDSGDGGGGEGGEYLLQRRLLNSQAAHAAVAACLLAAPAAWPAPHSPPAPLPAGYCFCNSTWAYGHQLAPPDAPPGER